MRTREEIVEYLKDCDTWELNLRIATLEACNPEKLFSDELQSLVDKALETLPEQTRDIFVRSRYNNQSHKEIAVALGISTKTVEFHITKALKVLRVALKDYFLYWLSCQNSFADTCLSIIVGKSADGCRQKSDWREKFSISGDK